MQLRKKYVKQRILGNERSTKQNPTNEDKMGNVKIKTSHFPKERLWKVCFNVLLLQIWRVLSHGNLTCCIYLGHDDKQGKHSQEVSLLAQLSVRIDLLSVYVLLTYFSSSDNTQEKCFFFFFLHFHLIICMCTYNLQR